MSYLVFTNAQRESPLIEHCPLCSATLDMSGLSPLEEVSCPACGVPIWARSIWNQYEILETLGVGGMGTVYLARDKYLGRQVALKILRLAQGSDPADSQKLAWEARTTAQVEHPNIVKIYDFGQSQGEFYIAMELIPGGSLHDRMYEEGGVSEEMALRVGIDVAEGLEAALKKGLIHRDIKPANILFAEDSTAKLVDFGLATALGGEGDGGDSVQGTPYYIAPERLDGRVEDFRSDIYSLGASLMHAISRVAPLDEEWPEFEKLQRLKGKQLDLAQMAPETWPPTVRVLNRMVAPDPAARFASYGELLEGLQAALHRGVIPDERASLSTKTGRVFKSLVKAGVAWARPETGK